MIRNRYYQRYFSRPNTDGDKFIDASTPQSVAFSNALYDSSKGLTHTFLHTDKGQPDDVVRLIGDVEICMSSDPSVTSQFSPMYRSQLRAGLVNAKGGDSPGLSDEQLLSSVPCNVKLERNEIDVVSRQQMDSLNSTLKREMFPTDDTSKETPSDGPVSTPPETSASGS